MSRSTESSGAHFLSRRMAVVHDVLGDLKYAVRAMRHRRGSTLLALLSMAIAIGANTAVYSVIDAVLLRPLPYHEADRIVALLTSFRATGEIYSPTVTIANFRDWRDQSTLFAAMSTYRGAETPVSAGAAAEYARTATVDARFFEVLAVRPVIGRTFANAEMTPGSRAALISHDYWRTRFGGDSRVLERTVRVGAEPWPIIGVLPPGFHFPSGTDLWFPQTSQSTSRTGHNFLAVGRLKTGVPLAQAQLELAAIAARLEQQYPQSNKDRGVAVRRLQDELVGDARLTLYLLWGVVGVVLLIACANTAMLLIGHATTRTREMGVRAAMGAGRLRIIRQLICESVALALMAGVIGVALAYWGVRALVALSPPEVVSLADASIDGRVLAFTLLVSTATGVVFGLVPALDASKVDLTDAVKGGGTRATIGGRMTRTRAVLVVAEVAMAVVLLTGAGLLVKSLVALQHVSLGFQPSNVLVMKATGVRSVRDNNLFFTNVFSRIAALPEVVAVGATSTPPGDLANAGSGSYFVDRVPAQRDRTTEPQALFTVVAPGSFAALGIPLKRGRDIGDGDTFDRPLVAVVNETLARKAFPGQDPIGRQIVCTFDRQDAMTIVGVVGDVRQRNPATDAAAECYMPYRQHTYNNRTLAVVMRTTGDPTALAATVRRVTAEVSPDVPVAFTTMDAIVSERVAGRRFQAVLFGTFAALALGLAVAGVYAVMAFAGTQRSKEIALRMALGANAPAMLRMVLKQGLALTAVGLTLGLAGAIAATQLLASVLFEVRPVDPPVYVGVALLLAVVTLLAGYLPARRAAATDPANVLKAE